MNDEVGVIFCCETGYGVTRRSPKSRIKPVMRNDPESSNVAIHILVSGQDCLPLPTGG